MKKILICTYYYNPYIHAHSFIASLRLSKFVKYLPNYGFEPYILAAKETRYLDSEKFIQTIPCNIHHTSFFDPYYDIVKLKNKNSNKITDIDNTTLKRNKRLNPYIIFKRQLRDLLMWPDSQIFWVLFGNAIKKGSEIIEHEKIDVIMSSSPPGTSHLLASILSRKFNIPWLADYRDSWTANGEFSRVGPLGIIDSRLEKRILSNARAISTVSESMANDLHFIHQKPTYVLTNGFDGDDYNYIIDLDRKFSITYTGHVTPLRMISLIILFEAISNLIKNGILDINDIIINIYGNNPMDTIKSEADKYKIGECLKLKNQVSYECSVEAQKRSQILLSLEGLENRKGVYTGKIFEYLAAKRPIIAISEENGAIKDLLNKTNSGLIGDNVEVIQEYVMHYYLEWKKNGCVEYHGVENLINIYNRREITHQLSEILNNLIQK